MRPSYPTLWVSTAMMAIAGRATTRATQVNSTASPGPASAGSWENTYRGAMTVTKLGSGVPQQWWATNPRIAFEVTNNAFSCAIGHPNAPDGSVRDSLTSGTMTGCVAGTPISGKVDGSVCVYSFALDRA